MADKSSTPPDLNVEEITKNILASLHEIQWQTWGTAVLYILCGFIAASFISRIAARILIKHTSTHYTQMIRRLLYYGILAISIIFALTALQLDMKVLGIATVLTLALGFASQTAMSNVVSGLFLVFERPFLIGDHLEFNDVTGELLSIDLLSIKIRTFDNTLVRIPNEILLKNKFSTLTKFPIRRLETEVQIAFSEDFEKVRKILLDLAHKNPNVLESPPAQLMFEKFTDNGLSFTFAVWFKKESFAVYKNTFAFDVYQVLKDNAIKMPSLTIHLEKPN